VSGFLSGSRVAINASSRTGQQDHEHNINMKLLWSLLSSCSLHLTGRVARLLTELPHHLVRHFQVRIEGAGTPEEAVARVRRRDAKLPQAPADEAVAACTRIWR